MQTLWTTQYFTMEEDLNVWPAALSDLKLFPCVEELLLFLSMLPNKIPGSRFGPKALLRPHVIIQCSSLLQELVKGEMG